MILHNGPPRGEGAGLVEHLAVGEGRGGVGWVAQQACRQSNRVNKAYWRLGYKPNNGEEMLPGWWKFLGGTPCCRRTRQGCQLACQVGRSASLRKMTLRDDALASQHQACDWGIPVGIENIKEHMPSRWVQECWTGHSPCHLTGAKQTGSRVCGAETRADQAVRDAEQRFKPVQCTLACLQPPPFASQCVGPTPTQHAGEGLILSIPRPHI